MCGGLGFYHYLVNFGIESCLNNDISGFFLFFLFYKDEIEI